MTKKIATTILSALIFAGLVTVNEANAQIFKKKKPAATETKKESEYEKFFKEKHETVSGLFTIHKMKEKLYFEMPLSLLGSEMLIGSTISQTSDNGGSIVGSKPLDPLHVKFTKNGNNIQLRAVDYPYVAYDQNSNIAKAIEMNSIGAVMKNIKIDVYSLDSLSVVFEMTDFFTGDNPKMSPFDRFSYYSMAGIQLTPTYQKEKSYLGAIKAFEDNMVIKSTLSYNCEFSDKLTKRSLLKDVPFSAEMTRSIVLLKKTPTRERLADYRVAIFPTAKQTLGENGQSVVPIFFANRWNVVPSDVDAYRRGEKVEPVTPIVFYVDPAFPAKWRPAIFEGIEQWNELFETIGFKNVVIAKDFPDDPEFDPDNIKYSCVRYAPIGIENAMGPSWVDPRSGEIVNASVYVYHNVQKLINNWRYVQTAQADPRVRTKNMPDEIFLDGLRHVIAHEIGHCLGFMHNMSSSSVIPVDSLRSAAFTQKYGTTASIMDYARNNYVAQPGDFEKGVKLTPPRFGAYDQFTIEWAYRYFPDAASARDEARMLEKFVSARAGDPVYRWGVQLGSPIDPRSQTEDLGDDAIAASKYGISNLKYILTNTDKWLGSGDQDFTTRREAYDGIIMQYFLYLNHVFTNVGGIYLNETKQGDPLQPFESFPAAKQRDAVKYLMSLYGDMEWLDNVELMKNIGLMGSPKDVLQTIVGRMIILSPTKVGLPAALSEEEIPYDFRRCSEDVFNFVWSSAISGRNPSRAEMKLQNEGLSVQLMVSQVGAMSAAATDVVRPEMWSPEALLKNADESGRYLQLYGQRIEAASHAADNSVYGNYYGRYSRLIQNDVDAYGYLIRIKKLLQTTPKSNLTPEVRAHYELLLKRINDSLKIE